MDGLYRDAETMLKLYIYDYMVRKNLHVSARVFKDEAGVPIGLEDINDSSFGFLSDWWSLFWDAYAARQSKIGVQQSSNEASSIHPNNQECNSQFIGIGSSSNEQLPQTQLLQPALIQQEVSSLNLADNTLLYNSLNGDNQWIKPEYHSANGISLYDNMIKQFNFLRCANQNVQALSTRRVPSNLTPHPNEGMHQAATQNPQQMNFGQLRLDGSPLNLIATQPKLKVPTFGFPQTGINLNADKNKLRIGPSSGIGSTSMNMEDRGLITPGQWDELLIITNQQQQYPMHGFHALRFGSHLQSQTVNASDPFPLHFQIDQHKVAERVGNENQRKRKEPSYSASEKSLGNREVTGPSQLPCLGLTSSLEEPAPETLSKSCGDLESTQPEITKQLDVSRQPKEDSGGKDAECQPTTTDDAYKGSL